jgi:hypothetical protein
MKLYSSFILSGSRPRYRSCYSPRYEELERGCVAENRLTHGPTATGDPKSDESFPLRSRYSISYHQIIFFLGEYMSSSQLTPWVRAYLKNLLVEQHPKKFRTFYRTWNFFITSKITRHWPLIWAALNQSISSQNTIRSVLILSSYLGVCLGVSGGFCLQFFKLTFPIHFSTALCMLYIPANQYCFVDWSS